MVKKGIAAPTWDEFQAYIGRKFAASLNQVNELSQYWNTFMFLWNPDFGTVTARARFKAIRGNVRMYPFYDHGTAAENPS